MDNLEQVVSAQYDVFQGTMERLDKPEKYLNYGYTTSRRDSYETRQERLCREVFLAAKIEERDVIVDVGFGSGEQDFLLAREWKFAKLIGFNIATRQVEYASMRAKREQIDGLIDFRLGAAEELPGIDPASVDKILAIECAFYFDRPKFYARAGEVLRDGGLLVLADISFADPFRKFIKKKNDLSRVGTFSSNLAAWKRHFATRSVISICNHTRPGAQMTVFRILKAVFSTRMNRVERHKWLKMAYNSQIVAIGLALGLLRYDLIILQKRK